MTRHSANLQKVSVKQAAKMMNVSERMVYEAARLRRSGRVDLIQQVEAGELILHRALILAGLKREPDKLRALCNAWTRCSEGERAQFIDILKAATKAKT